MAADDLVGTSLGRYRIEAFVARGGMGVVYRAFAPHLGVPVALKVLSPALAGDEGIRDRFLREPKSAARLDSDHIIPVVDAGEIDGVHFIAMRWVPEGDLAGVLSRERRLAPDRALAILAQVADALDTAHAAGLVHRDVKPRNILMRGRGRDGRERVYLTDFGIARRLDAHTVASTQGLFLGTLQYAAPEQFLGGEVDHRADIYALGCVLYECLTGQAPFAGLQEMALAYAHVNAPPPSAHALRPELPAGLDRVIARAMAKDRDARFASSGELVVAASAALAGMPETVVVPWSPPPPPAPPPSGPHSGEPWSPEPPAWPTTDAHSPGGETPERQRGYQAPRTRRSWTAPAVGVLAVALAFVIAYTVVAGGSGDTGGTPAPVGTVSSGTPASAARTASPPARSAAATATAVPPTTGAPSASAQAGQAFSYPASGDAPCGGDSANGTAYAGLFKRIRALDTRTVEFQLCAPDAAFLSKVALPAFAINDAAYLESSVPDGSIVSQPNGTGPFRLSQWTRGSEIGLDRNPGYWGTTAGPAAAVFRWSADAGQRLAELQSGSVDGIDDPGPDDFDTIQGDPDLQFTERPGLNVFYVGFNNTQPPFDNEKIRQAIAQGIDRQRIVERFYPPGSRVATHFTPCEIEGGCGGQPWYEFDAEEARRLLAEGMREAGVSRIDTQIHLRDTVRGYLPRPLEVAQDLQAQLQENLGITAEIDVRESTPYIVDAIDGKLPGIHLLGWGADYPDPTSFLDIHFGTGASAQFGGKFPDITGPLATGASEADQTARNAAYAQANTAIRQHVPMIPIARIGSGAAWRADIANAHSSPLYLESLAELTAAGRDRLVFMQKAEPEGLYCADEASVEALRVCAQIFESLYAYETGGTVAEPALAESCDPNPDLTVWTCALRQGVTFHDGSTLDARDVVVSYAVQWDAQHPLHKGRTNDFPYFPAVWGGFLNAPRTP